MAKVVQLPQYATALRALDTLLADRARYPPRQWLEMADELQSRIDQMYKTVPPPLTTPDRFQTDGHSTDSNHHSTPVEPALIRVGRKGEL